MFWAQEAPLSGTGFLRISPINLRVQPHISACKAFSFGLRAHCFVLRLRLFLTYACPLCRPKRDVKVYWAAGKELK